MKKLNVDPLQLGGTVDPGSTIYAMTMRERRLLYRALIYYQIHNGNLLNLANEWQEEFFNQIKSDNEEITKILDSF